MSDLTNVKVGDKLFVRGGSYDKGKIVTADRITPTGRIITTAGEFNPDGSRRGGNTWHRTHARLATEDDIAGVYRYGLVQNLTHFRLWEKLSADDLKTAAGIIAKYKAQP